MIILISLFCITFLGMMIIPLRHMPRLRRASEDDILNHDADANSIARVRIVGTIDQIENWYHASAKNLFLKFIDRMLAAFERSAGKIAGRTKNMRIMVQERFRVIPRESLYWKHIHTWKRENGTTKTKIILEEEGIDVSNHIL
jgi:hypothetical protein